MLCFTIFLLNFGHVELLQDPLLKFVSGNKSISQTIN